MKIRSIQSALLSTAFLLSLAANAEVRLDDSYTWRRAQTLAPGQQIFAFESSYQDFSDKYSAEGRVEPLGNQYSRSVTWNQLLRADTQSADVKAYMQKNGLTGNEVAATSNYEVNRSELGFGFNWAYGLMTNWMIGIEVPLSLTTTRVVQHVNTAPQVTGGEALTRVRQLAEMELATSGYDRIPTQKQSWDVGDISLRSQQVLARSYSWSWALQQMVRFPTAQNPSVSDYVQTSQDEGPVDLGLTSLMDFEVRRMIIGLRAGYVSQLPDTARMRVAGGDGNTGVDPKVNRKLGDWAWGAVDTEYQVTRNLDLSAEYSFLSKAKDRYSGDSFSASDYASLSEHTDQQLHQTRVGMLYRIGTSSTRGGVTNKWMAALNYTYPWIGRNATEAARTSLELINYF